jgi:hypothetical protein
MEIVETPGAAQRLRRSLGRPGGHFQQTFRTPLKQLEAFAATVLTAHAPIETGRVNVEQVVFTPKNLEALLTDHRLPLTYGPDWTITTSDQNETAALIEAAWGDWLDFYFTPAPKRYHILADHDEYTTIFAATKGHLAKVATALSGAGFSRVEGYERKW